MVSPRPFSISPPHICHRALTLRPPRLKTVPSARDTARLCVIIPLPYQRLSEAFVEPFELQLPDGRLLAGAAYGPGQGVPVFYFHGLPGCRREPSMFVEPALTRLGIRLIALER